MAHAMPEHDGVDLKEVVADPAEAQRRLDQFAERVANGTVVVHSTEEVRERLNRADSPPDEGTAGPDQHPPSSR